MSFLNSFASLSYFIDANETIKNDPYLNNEIVEEALKSGITEIKVTEGRFNVFYHPIDHKTIKHPFVVHMASAWKVPGLIICVRPQT